MFCGGGIFGLWPKIRPNGKSTQKTKLSSDRHILLFGSVRCLHYVCLFLFDHPVDVNEGTISFRVRLVSPCCDRRKTSPRSRGERGGKIIYSFCAPKKESSFLLCRCCCRVISLLFYNYLWIIFARAPWASSLLFFYCLLVVQTVESSSSGGVVFSRWSFLSLSLTRALFHHS